MSYYWPWLQYIAIDRGSYEIQKLIISEAPTNGYQPRLQRMTTGRDSDRIPLAAAPTQ